MNTIKIGVLGAGSFARSFIPLFQAHPLVTDVYVAETMPERLSQVVDDFIKACATDSLPSVNVWTAAKYCAPGIIAHESALREGEHMTIPNLGDAPEK